MSGVSTVTLTSAEGVRFDVNTGALWLDLVYSGGAGARARWETLHTPADLARWVRSSRLAVTARVALTPDDFADAYELREVFWRLGNDLADGLGARRTDVTALNRWAREPDLVPVLRGGRRAWAGPITGSQVLSTLARDAIATASGPLAARVRRCAAADCPLLFVDTSRPGTRRWCAMTRCGNRTKVRAHRAHPFVTDRADA